MATETENIRVRFPPTLLKEWRDVLEARRITQQAAITALVEWVVRLDPLHQTILFKQVPEEYRGQLARIVLEKLADGKGRAKGK